MKAVVLYDSAFGNTEQVAQTIAESIGGAYDVRLLLLDDAAPTALIGADLVIVGSPTQGGQPTQKLRMFLAKLPANIFKNVHVAAFDTRFSDKDHGMGVRLLMRVIGFAASKIARSLRAKGGVLIVPPVGYIVSDKEGPLAEGELERAMHWAQGVIHHGRFDE